MNAPMLDARPFFLTPQDIRIDDRFMLFYDNKIVADGDQLFWTLETVNPEVVVGGTLFRVDEEGGAVASVSDLG